MKASDIMTSPVIAVAPDTPVPEIAALLCERRISGVPVLDHGTLVGIVSEADLLPRHEIGTDHIARSGSWWLRWFSAGQSVTEYVKSHARTARDVMTPEVLSVSPHTPAAEIATLLETRRIKRVPVLDGGRLAGIVSRADLVQALATRRPFAKERRPGNDDSIREDLLAELERQSWWRSISSNVLVTEGVVHFFGTIESDDQRIAARVAAENVPGVRGVEDHRVRLSELTWSL
jgi:CBS domain-containing protein